MIFWNTLVKICSVINDKLQKTQKNTDEHHPQSSLSVPDSPFQAIASSRTPVTQDLLVVYSRLVPKSLSPLPESSPTLLTRRVPVAYSSACA